MCQTTDEAFCDGAIVGDRQQQSGVSHNATNSIYSTLDVASAIECLHIAGVSESPCDWTGVAAYVGMHGAYYISCGTKTALQVASSMTNPAYILPRELTEIVPCTPQYAIVVGWRYHWCRITQ